MGVFAARRGSVAAVACINSRVRMRALGFQLSSMKHTFQDFRLDHGERQQHIGFGMLAKACDNELSRGWHDDTWLTSALTPQQDATSGE